MVEGGIYRGLAHRALLSEASTGNAQIAVVFDLLDYPGEKLTWFGYFTDKAFPVTMRALSACGWTGNDFGVFDGNDGALPEEMNQEVELVVTQEQNPNSGAWQNKVQWVNKPGGVGVKNVMDATAVRAFAAQMRQRAAAFRASEGGAAMPAPAAPRTAPPAAGASTRTAPAPGRTVAGSPPGAADDIPF